MSDAVRWKGGMAVAVGRLTDQGAKPSNHRRRWASGLWPVPGGVQTRASKSVGRLLAINRQ